MPELPEVEHLRRTLEPTLRGRRVQDVRLNRADIVRNARRRPPARDLLRGTVIDSLLRHGKQLALVGDSGRVICVHLGMSGQMRHLEAGERLPDPTHVHAVWRLGRGEGRLVFRDPRRFGGLWTYPSLAALRAERWDPLGADALDVRTASLAASLGRTQRVIKAALLDQAVLAGLGNIYVDEVLFLAGVHPLTPACHLPRDRVRAVAGAIRRILSRAVAAGGTTLRDYVDGQGRNGAYASAHRVYGRAGLPCMVCGSTLAGYVVSQRTTVACPVCQCLEGG